jgi:hypothetical protein
MDKKKKRGKEGEREKKNWEKKRKNFYKKMGHGRKIEGEREL